MTSRIVTDFAGLIRAPFQHPAFVWGIVPLYFSLLLGELTSAKANFRTAIQTGFSFLWAGAQWLCQHLDVWQEGAPPPRPESASALPIKMAVTSVVLVLGAVALFSGLRRRYPKYGSFLGYTRFSSYFMITIYPMQSGGLDWSWNYVVAIAICAVPIWLALHFSLMPLRNRK